MTNPAMEEIYTLVEHALHAGQKNIEVHAFPFRMTAANLAANSRSGWYSYWLNLKQGYDLFEDTRIPPKVSVCGKQYAFDGGESDEVATLTGSPNRGVCLEEPNVASAPKVAAGSALINPPKVVQKSFRRVAVRYTRKAQAAASRARTGSLARRTHAGGAFGKTRKR